MLKTSSLTYAYAGQAPMAFPDLHCAKDEHWLLLGRSGSGKTTLLHLLAGLLRPRSGQVIIEGTDITQLRPEALDTFRGQQVGLIFQRSHFVRALTVAENLALARRLAGRPADPGRVRALLGALGIGSLAGKKPSRLSVGEQQRAAIARALVNRPAVILADEPTSALDDVNCRAVADLLEREARAVGATLLVVTHDQRLKDLFPRQVTLASLASANPSSS